MKTHRLALFAVVALVASHALAQTPGTPAPAPKPAAPPAVTSAPPPPPPAPAPPAPRKEGQPINIRVDTTISESGGNAPPVKKTVTAVAGDGFDASVREIATPAAWVRRRSTSTRRPTILSNGKIRVRVTLQYAAGQSQPAEQRVAHRHPSDARAESGKRQASGDFRSVRSALRSARDGGSDRDDTEMRSG